MKRINHFTTKQIDINQVTRPNPRPIQPIEERVNKPRKLEPRSSLAVKLNLASNFSTYQLSKIIKSTPTPRPKPIKPTKERIIIRTESKYAGKPEKKVSNLLNKIIESEAYFFRQLSENGSSKMENGDAISCRSFEASIQGLRET